MRTAAVLLAALLAGPAAAVIEFPAAGSTCGTCSAIATDGDYPGSGLPYGGGLVLHVVGVFDGAEVELQANAGRGWAPAVGCSGITAAQICVASVGPAAVRVVVTDAGASTALRVRGFEVQAAPAGVPPSWGELLLEVSRGNVPGISAVHKFGSGVVTTTPTPVTRSGFYRTPIAATALEVVSNDADDTAAGAGAQEVTIVGLDATWSVVTQVIETAGLTDADLTTDLIRLRRWYVSRSGTYATQAASSHEGTLTIQEDGGGDVWSVIDLVAGSLGRGQSQIGADTVPAGKVGWILAISTTVDGAKSVSPYLFHRPNADDVTTPFTGALRIVRELFGMVRPYSPPIVMPLGPFVGPCDIGFLGVGANGTDVSVDFELLIIDGG